MADEFTATFLPSGAQVRVPAGTSLLEAAHQAGIQVNAVCGGKGSCGKCRARLREGMPSEVSPVERDFISQEQQQQGVLLLCQRKMVGDITLEVLSPAVPSRAYTPAKGKIDQRFDVDPLVLKSYHELTPPTIEDQTADLDRVLKELPGQVKVGINLVSQIPVLLREANYQVTAVVVDQELIALERGDTCGEMYGIAFDIGTTSVAGYLVNLRDGQVAASTSAGNRQRVHGADVISRITYAKENEGGLARLKQLVAETLDEISAKLVQQAGVSADRVYFLTLIGNTVMSHLLLGASPIGVASAPFIPAFARGLSGSAQELGLKNLPACSRFALLPNVAGYVGSDTVGVILATQIYQLPGTWLAVDIGTNGEIALASAGRVLTCSTAAGPAFEGASISQGMRAEPGAIFKVDIDEDVRLEVVGGAVAQGICGSGLIDAVSEMVRLGILRANGRIKHPEECPAELSPAVKDRIKLGEKGLKFVLAEGSTEVCITQKDISELQLGKGAVRAGIEILMEELDVKAGQFDGILVAGAFGSNLRPESVKGIGMFPEIELKRIKPVGNAAGTGAIMALLARQQLQLAADLPQRVEHVELSLHSGFTRKFAQAISF